MEKLGTPCLWIGSTGFRRLFIFVNKVLPIASRRVNSSSAAYWQKKPSYRQSELFPVET
jgi:hypothetical protein